MRIPIALPKFDGSEQSNLLSTIEDGRLSAHRWVDTFESNFAAFIGVKHAITVMNGTVALHLALVAAGVQPGDEVIVPAFTYVATANAVRYIGAVPVFADVLPDTWCIDPSDVARRITRATRAIIPVDMYGYPANLLRLELIAQEHSLTIVHDCAESHGAQIYGRMTGSFGAAGIFSFYGNKIITTGEGGMITTNDDQLATRARLYRGQGVSPSQRYFHEVVGFNYRMTDMQAAVGVAQLRQINEFLLDRKRIAATYRARVAAESDYGLQFQARADFNGLYCPANWMVSVILPTWVDRDRVQELMATDSIETRPGFVAIPDLPMYADSATDWPISRMLARQVLCLPTYASLDDDEVEYVVDSLLKALKGLHDEASGR